MSLTNIIILSTVFIFSHTVVAADNISPPPSLTTEEKLFTAPSPLNKESVPELPNEEDDSRNIPQPEVRIIRKKDVVVEEYRVNGHLRYVKITPSIGPAYYMVDTDGDGVLETREDDLSNPPINQWILYKW